MATVATRNVREIPISVMGREMSLIEAAGSVRRAGDGVRMLKHRETDDALMFGDLGQRTTMRRLGPFLTNSWIAHPLSGKRFRVDSNHIFDDEIDSMGRRWALSLSGIRGDYARDLGRLIERPDVGLYFKYKELIVINGTVLVVPRSIIPVFGLLPESGLGVAHGKTRVPVSPSAPYADEGLGERQWERLEGQSVRVLARFGSDPRARAVVSSACSHTGRFWVPYTDTLQNAARA